MITASSFSSETSTAVFPDARSELIMMSFESTSSFFCSSPCTFVSPAAPMLHEHRMFRTVHKRRVLELSVK